MRRIGSDLNFTADVVQSDPTESLPIDDSFSPVLHRIDSAIRHRAIHPNDPIPPPASVLTKFSHPPDDLVEKSKKYLDKLVAVSDVKKGQSISALSLLGPHHTHSDESSPTKNKRHQTDPRNREATIRSRRRCPSPPREAHEDLTQQRNSRVQANALAGGEHRDHQGCSEADEHYH